MPAGSAPPLDMEAVKRRQDWAQAQTHKSGYASVARAEASIEGLCYEPRTLTDALLDRRDLIAEIDRLTAKLEDQNERIAQLHRERGEATEQSRVLRQKLERALHAGLEAAEGSDVVRTHLRDATEWRPIESAPKDGTDILCLCEDIGVRVLYWHVHYEAWALAGGDLNHYEPTHWMPTPPETR